MARWDVGVEWTSLLNYLVDFHWSCLRFLPIMKIQEGIEMHKIVYAEKIIAILGEANGFLWFQN